MKESDINIVKNYMHNGEVFEKLVFYEDSDMGLIIAIHSTVLGPALGGCRLLNGYDKEQALDIVCNMAKTMTYKNCIARLNYGGGKCFIYRYNEKRRECVLKTLAILLNRLRGEYLTADDVGTDVFDMDIVRKYTRYAHGISYGNGQIPATSIGVFNAIEVFLDKVLKKKISEASIAIQGIGKVGGYLAVLLAQKGARIYVSELDCEKKYSLKKYIDYEEIEDFIRADVDILAPCALGNVINEDNYSYIVAKGIVGGANNPLSSDIVNGFLWRKNIIYIPDFISNCGGVIDVDCEGENYSYHYVVERLGYIREIASYYIDEAMTQNKSPMEVAVHDVQCKIRKEEK